MTFTISRLLSITKFCKDWPCISLEDVNGRRTTHNNGRQTVAILRHLNDTGDLKMTKYVLKSIFSSQFQC